jgi:hypothetical protein
MRPSTLVEAKIRVLTIVNGTSDKVTCKLETVSLHILPVYKALSYCWGSETDTRTVVISGHEVNLTCNLDAALRQFGSENHSGIWIDAICIYFDRPRTKILQKL